MRQGRQSSLEFYKDQEIATVPRVGQIVIARHYIFSNNFRKPGTEIYVPHLIVNKEESQKAYYEFKQRNNSDFNPIITTTVVRRHIRSHNWSLEWNNPPKKAAIEFLTRATKKNVKLGDTLVRIVKLIKRYKTEEITYDGTMSVRGYYILNNKQDGSN